MSWVGEVQIWASLAIPTSRSRCGRPCLQPWIQEYPDPASNPRLTQSATHSFWGPGQVVPLDHYNIVGDLWMWIWMFISSILLVNLLIAMFTETCEHLRIELIGAS